MTGKIEYAGIGSLIEKLTRARRRTKALAVGAAAHHDWLVSLARGLSDEGVLIVFYADAARMRTLRDEFEHAGVAGRTNVMLGNPALLVRKVAGPFEVVLNCESGDEETWRARLMPLVAPGGVLIAAIGDGIRIDVR